MNNIYLGSSGQQTGPFSEHEVRRMVSDGRALASDPGWREGLAEWRPLYEILRLARPLPPPPPPGDHAPAPSVSYMPPPPPPVAAPAPAPVFTAPAPSPPPSGATSGSGAAEPVYFYISPGRLAAMAFASMGLFQGYWVYRNWRNIQRRDGSLIQPFWRGIFALFFIGPLLDVIAADPVANRLSPARFSARGLALGWCALFMAGNVGGRTTHSEIASMVGLAFSLVSVCCLVPVQEYVNTVVEKAGVRRRHDAWSAGQIVCLALGLTVWVCTLMEFSGSKFWSAAPRPSAAISTPAPAGYNPELFPKGPNAASSNGTGAKPPLARATDASYLRAVQLYPDAAVDSSPLARAVTARCEQLSRGNPGFFAQRIWPELVVHEVAESMGIRDTRVLAALETMTENSNARNVRSIGPFMATIHPLCPQFSETQQSMESFFNEGLYRFSMSDVRLLHENDTEVLISCQTRYSKEDGSGRDIHRTMRYVLHPWMGRWKIYSFDVIGES